jgi:hypothetical protein
MSAYAYDAAFFLVQTIFPLPSGVAALFCGLRGNGLGNYRKRSRLYIVPLRPRLSES